VFSQTEDEYAAKISQGVVGVLGDIEDGDWTQYRIIGPLTSKYTQNPPHMLPVSHVNTGGFAISSTNKYPERSIQWVDYLYRTVDNAKDGICGLSVGIGLKGVDWDYNATKSAITILRPADPGISQAATLNKHVTPGYGIGLIVMPLPYEGDFLAKLSKTNAKYFYPYLHQEDLFPSAVRFTPSQNDELTTLRNDINTYVVQMQAKFITGEAPLSQWNSYLSTLKKMGSDKFVKDLQAAYNRYAKN
jgi:putative aldouronate transport system substrate-binding protein